MREKEKKTQEAMNAIRDARRAKWQSKVADAMESFEVAGIDATHDEMLRKVQEQTAVNEARMQMALESVDHQALQIEEDAEKLQAQELVKQFKMEMGLASPAPVSDDRRGPGEDHRQEGGGEVSQPQCSDRGVVGSARWPRPKRDGAPEERAAAACLGALRAA